MKRLSKKRKAYIRRRLAKRERYLRKQRRRVRRARRLIKRTLRIIAPYEFNLLNPRRRAALLQFLQALRENVVLRRRPVTLDFSQTSRMYSDGTLLFRAELSRILRNTGGKVTLQCVPPNNNKVAQVLKQVGVYRLLKYRSKVKPKDEDVVNWRVANGSGVEGQKYDDILGSYDGVISTVMAEGLYRGLTEAMTNCHQHAYLWERPDGLEIKDDAAKDWWMFSQEKDGTLSVVFCDLGVGIPATLPKRKPSLWESVVAKFANPPDGEVIREAIEFSKTRTGRPYRGKGLRQLSDSIERAAGSTLCIYSNHGCYIYKNDGTTEVKNFTDSILGTLIFWNVPLPKELEST